MKKIVLAYSGGLDTSVILPWLREKYGCEVIAFAAELGQGDELEGIKKKALASGASKCVVVDLRREFVEDYLWPLLRSGAVYENGYLLGTSIARPLIAKEQVRVAHQEGADAVAHGATGKGNDQVRFELTFMALDPTLQIVAPWKDPTFELTSREAAVEYAKKHNIPIAQTKKKIYSRDRNIWHISHEGGILEDPWNEPEEAMFTLTVAPEKAPDEPAYLEIEFEKGRPTAVNGVTMDSVSLVEKLNQIAGANGVGRVDMVENRLVGMKSRGVYETPGGTVLYAAHRGLETLTLDRETMHYKDTVSIRYAELVYYGQWFTTLKESLDAFVSRTQRRVSGTVRMKLFKGNCTVVGVKSPYSLYREDFATFGADEVYDQQDAEGFINLFGLPLKVEAMLKMNGGTSYDQPDYSVFKRD